jgi:hypothetical protein
MLVPLRSWRLCGKDQILAMEILTEGRSTLHRDDGKSDQVTKATKQISPRREERKGYEGNYEAI